MSESHRTGYGHAERQRRSSSHQALRKGQIYNHDLCIIKNIILFAPELSLMLKSQDVECWSGHGRQSISMSHPLRAPVCVTDALVQGHVSSFEMAQPLEEALQKSPREVARSPGSSMASQPQGSCRGQVVSREGCMKAGPG